MIKFVTTFIKQKTGQYSAAVKLKLIIVKAIRLPCINGCKKNAMLPHMLTFGEHMGIQQE
jgi:hypothetical protein